MTITKKMTALNLNIAVPRSSKDTMAGLAHLPRMIDKARAFRNGILGEYIYPCPLDQRVLNFLNTSPEDFLDLAEVYDDEHMAEWAQEASRSRIQIERGMVNGKILNRKVDPEDMPSFLKKRDLIDPTRTDVTTWDGLMDLEEGHI